VRGRGVTAYVEVVILEGETPFSFTSEQGDDNFVVVSILFC
jgi:hypothetical protein